MHRGTTVLDILLHTMNLEEPISSSKMLFPSRIRIMILWVLLKRWTPYVGFFGQIFGASGVTPMCWKEVDFSTLGHRLLITN